MSQIFLSYSSKDRERVRGLVDLLSELGPVWWDQKIRAGRNWENAVEQAVKDAACVVVAWTENSVTSEYVRSEAGYARDHGTLVPVLLDPVDPPLAYRNIQTVQLQDWNGESFHPQAQALKAAVTEVLAETAASREKTNAVEPAAAASQPVRPPPSLSPTSEPHRRKPTPAVIATAGLLALVGYVGLRQINGDRAREELVGKAADIARDTTLDASPANDTGKKATAAPPPIPGTGKPLAVPNTTSDSTPPPTSGSSTSATPGTGGTAASQPIQEIIVSETETATLAQALGFLDSDSLRRGYHYLVDMDGRVYSYFNESRRARHTAGHNAASLAIGMVHIAGHTPYTPAQVDGLVALLTTLAHDYRVDVRSIRSKGEVDPRRPKEITAQMPEIRRRVGALLAEWRLNGTRPGDAQVAVSEPLAKP